MSKVLIDFEVLQTVMKALDFGIRQLSRNYTDDYSELAYAQNHLERAIKESNSKRISVLEWHSMDEKPNKFSWVITKDINGLVSSDYVVYDDSQNWRLEHTEKRCLTAWSYLPE